MRAVPGVKSAMVALTGERTAGSARQPAPSPQPKAGGPGHAHAPRGERPVQGPPGVGKTHMVVALGIRAIEQGFSVAFYRLEDLLHEMRKERGVAAALRRKKYSTCRTWWSTRWASNR